MLFAELDPPEFADLVIIVIPVGPRELRVDEEDDE